MVWILGRFDYGPASFLIAFVWMGVGLGFGSRYLKTTLLSQELLHLSRRLRITPSTRLDGVEFVLYLRSFSNDRFTGQLRYGLNNDPKYGPTYTEEEMLCMLMNRLVGKVVAMGTPGERVPHVGAERIYAEGSDWREVVLVSV
jgi:hypothetical protein